MRPFRHLCNVLTLAQLAQTTGLLPGQHPLFSHKSSEASETSSVDGETGIPPLHVLLTPQFDNDNLTSINVTMKLKPSQQLSKSFDLLFSTPELAGTACLNIKPGTLRVSDANGDLEVTTRRQPASDMLVDYWSTERTTEGVVQVSYVAMPRYVDNMTRSGPALDFRLESQGFTSSAFAVLMTPADINTLYNVSFAWDLENAPAGTKAVWSFGEHPRTITSTMPALGLLKTYLGAGPLRAFQDESQMEKSKLGFNVYWFDEPPFAAPEMSKSLLELFEAMSAFFEDDEDDYRVFMRHNPYAGTNTGTALDRSFVMGYDDTDFDGRPHVHDKLRVIAHEMVHNWILWSESTDTAEENWYPEGMAEYYSLLFLYQLGISSAEEYVNEINKRLSSYYTSPYARKSVTEAAKHTWETTAAQRLPYRRGFSVALALDDLIYGATGGTSTLDDVILHLIKLKKSGQVVGPTQFINTAASLVGDLQAVQDMYNLMKNGSQLILPREESLRTGRFALPVTLKRQDQELFELGFSETAARSEDHVIEDLVAGSRAEAAGLRNGDVLADQIQVSNAEADFGKNLSMRYWSPHTGQWRMVEFWPHAREKTESWFFQWDRV